jgi:hypothetical protein
MPLGIDELTAAPRTIELGGRRLQLSPLTLADMGVLQAWIHAQLPDPVALARRLAEGMPVEVQTELLRDAFKHAMAARRTHLIGTDEADELLATMAGFLEILGLTLKAHHPEMTRDVLGPLVGGLTRDQINEVTAHAFGVRMAPADLPGAGTPDPKGPAVGSNGDAGAPSTSTPWSSTSPAGTTTPPT